MKITAEQAIIKIEQMLREVEPALKAAIRFHQVRRETPPSEQAQGFAGARARQTPVDHAHRAEVCKNNKLVIDTLRARIGTITKQYHE